MNDIDSGQLLGPAGEAAPVRVLIIDDNASFAGLLAAALDTVDGLACVGTATTATEGFSAVTDLAPSVVVMDIMMPGIDGLAATHQLRQLHPEIAVAVTSAHSQGEWIARADTAGACAYISKGGSLTEMIEVLKTVQPGPMIVAPSLQQAWSSWEPPTEESEAPVREGRRARAGTWWRMPQATGGGPAAPPSRWHGLFSFGRS